MKIGILTFHLADNYGAVLQAYALQNILQDMGHEARILNYQDKALIRAYKIFGSWKPRAVIKGILKMLLKEPVKHKKFQDFRRRYLDLSKMCYDIWDINGFDLDAVIVGSDQVWNTTITGKNPIYFLEKHDEKLKAVSYAASIGNLEDIDAEKGFIAQGLSNFDYISVREQSISGYFSDIVQRKIYTVLDPTLVVKKSVWDSFLRDVPQKEKYVFVYRMTYHPLIEKLARYIAGLRQSRIVSISTYAKPEMKSGIRSKYGIGPEQFLNYIHGAEFVITDSFHGTAFSLAFNKNFYSVLNPRYGGRIEELLKRLGLEERIFCGQSDFNSISLEMDYGDINQKVKKLQEESMDFLKLSLKEGM